MRRSVRRTFQKEKEKSSDARVLWSQETKRSLVGMKVCTGRGKVAVKVGKIGSILFFWFLNHLLEFGFYSKCYFGSQRKGINRKIICFAFLKGKCIMFKCEDQHHPVRK